MLEYTVIIECKDGRYRYKINQLNLVTVKKNLDMGGETFSTVSEPLMDTYGKLVELENKIEEYGNLKLQNPNVKRSVRGTPEKETLKPKKEFLKQEKVYNANLKVIYGLIDSLKPAMKKDDSDF